MPTTEGKWYHDQFLVESLCDALINAEVFESAADTQEFRHKPQKYTAYYEAWEESGFPNNEDDDNWDEFCEAVTSDEDESDDT